MFSRKSITRLCLPVLLLAVSTNGSPMMQDIDPFQGETFSSRVTYSSSSSSSSRTHEALVGSPAIPSPNFPSVDEKRTLTGFDYGDSAPLSSSAISSAESRCHPHGVFAKPGSCMQYYQCEEIAEHGLFSIHLLSCPLGKIFNDELNTCEYPHPVNTRPECQDVNTYAALYGTKARSVNELLTGFPERKVNRKKRFAIIPALTGILSHPLAKAAAGLFGASRGGRKSDDAGADLKGLESKLIGIDGKLKHVELSVLESQAENKMNNEILQNLVTKGSEENQVSFAVTQKMINQGILENQISSAVIQGLISQQGRNNENNFVKVQVSLGEIKTYINQEITDTKTVIKRGFESVSNSIDQARIEPIVSKLLTTITNFNKRSNHIQSLPEKDRIDAIKRSGGYLEYLESSTIQDSLFDILNQNLAIPDDDTDLSAVFILDLLVKGLQVQANIMSSVVLSNSFLAAKALEDTNLEEFNTYMMRTSSSLTRVKLELGNEGGKGLIEEVKGVLNKVQSLPFASDIIHLSQLLVEKRSEIEQIEFYIDNLISESAELNEPGIITGKPDFKTTSVVVPIAAWENGKVVSYAIQHVSETGISRIGAWSTPYNIHDKANPTIKLPTATQGIVRTVYRRFGQEKPELVAVLTNHEQRSFRDIDRDLLNAAAKPNEDQAVQEVTSLINDGADVNTAIGNKMTPLHYAAKHGNVKVMDILMAKSANIHAKTSDIEEPLHFAALFGGTEGVEYLVSKGARVNAQTRSLGLSPLHIAVANNHVDATQALITNGAFINIKDNNGLTPLHISVTGNGDTTDVLLGSDAIDVNVIANDGLTPLHYGARSSNDAFVRKLLQHKDIDINPQTSYLLSPLHLAAMADNIVDITELVQRGVPGSVVDASGSTPLHYAAFYGSQKAALAMLQIDESMSDIKNNEGKTALDLAVENKRVTVAKILGGKTEGFDQIFAEELSDEPVRLEPSSESVAAFEQLAATNCTTDTVEQMAESSEETCAHIGNIESYVNLVMSMIPLEIYYDSQEEFTLIFRNYDRDLGIAQNNAKIWRNGDSIVQGIRETFDLAKEFEPEFSRKYKINQQRVEVIKENVDQVKIINQTKDDIAKLEEQLASATEAMSQVQVTAVLAYFHATINDINASIEEKKRALKEDFTLIHELEELADFLEFVRRDSNKIREVALKTREKLETFRDNLDKDKGAFERHGRIASEAFEKLQNETIRNNEALAENKRKQQELEIKIEEERQAVKAKYEEINKAHQELRKMRRQLLDKISKSKTLKIIGAILSPTIIGAFLYVHAKREEKNYGRLLQSTLAQSKLEVDDLNSQIENNYKQIKLFQELMANSTSNSESLRNEMNDFITLDGDLKNMADKVETLLEAINKALVGVKVIKGVFDSVTKKLSEMIELARTAKTEAERLNAKYFIYNELSLLECNWRDVYIKVMNLDECTRNFEILY